MKNIKAKTWAKLAPFIAIVIYCIFCVPDYKVEAQETTANKPSPTLAANGITANSIATALFKQITAARMRAFWAAEEGYVKPLGEESNQPIFKTIVYFTVLCPDEAFGENGYDDFFTHLHKNNEWYRAYGSPVTANVERDTVRKEVVKTILESQGLQKALIDEVVKSTIRATIEGTDKRRDTLLRLIKSGQTYLNNMDLAAEKAWHSECLVILDKEVQKNKEGRAKMYLFNKYSPGKFAEGATEEPDRHWHTFLFRRIENDGISKENLYKLLTQLQEAIYAANK